jgi:hypothetical protein
VLSPAHAQQILSPTLQKPPAVEQSLIQGIVDVCKNNTADNPCENITPELTLRTVTFQIPEFQPGDQETHVYVVSRISNNGAGGGSAQADEYGILRDEVLVTQLQGEEETQYYFTAVDIDTLEARVTLDLYEVELRRFLNSFQNALQMGRRAASGTRLNMTAVRSMMAELMKYRDQKLSIQGENLTVDELLDKLYQETGCIVDQEAEGLVIANCP